MKKNPSYHHPDLRSALFAAARIELREYGPAFASLRRIAARAGVSHTAPYRHFENKDGLLGAMGWEGQAEFTSRLRRVRESVSGSAGDRLFRLGQEYLEFAGDSPEVFLLMFSETGIRAMGSHFPPDFMACVEKYDSFSVLETTVKECQAERLLDPRTDSGVLAMLIWSMIHGFALIEREGLAKHMGESRGYDLPSMRRSVLGALRGLIEAAARAP